MEINEIFRRARPYSADPEWVDGHRNFFAATAHPLGLPLIAMDSGIYKPESQFEFAPVIFISSSPHKYGSNTTPWQDVIRADAGYIKYYGDNKVDNRNNANDPAIKKGNRYLLEQYSLHSSNLLEDRMRAAPILCFRSEEVEGKKKGFISFQGICLIEKVELVTQIDQETNKPFANYCFELLVLTLKYENEKFNYDWINQRRSNPDLAKTLELAPAAWKDWVKNGAQTSQTIRRNALEKQTQKTAQQIPKKGSREELIRREIYEFYGGSRTNVNKKRFEYLAALITARVIKRSGGNYVFGWITQGTGDNAIDFVGRLDIGGLSGEKDYLARVKLVVLGQAKCEHLDSPTNGQHIARTVARLKRGWLAVYVTTSYFSEPVQLEILEDRYPILLINGLTLASEIRAMMIEKSLKIDRGTIVDFLTEIDTDYEKNVHRRSPEEVLLL
jgi:hypothetical protein